MNRSLSNKDNGQEHLKTLKKYIEKLRDKKSIFGKLSISMYRERSNKGGNVERDMEEFMKYESTNEAY